MGPVTATALLLLVATLTPGPNNLLMLQIGLAGGMRAALRPATGVVLGGLLMLLGAYSGVAALVAAHPRLRPLITLGGAVFVAWLGLRLICSSFATPAARSPAGAASPGGLLGMALFQLTNPKSWLLVLTVSATPLVCAGPETTAKREVSSPAAKVTVKGPPLVPVTLTLPFKAGMVLR